MGCVRWRHGWSYCKQIPQESDPVTSWSGLFKKASKILLEDLIYLFCVHVCLWMVVWEGEEFSLQEFTEFALELGSELWVLIRPYSTWQSMKMKNGFWTDRLFLEQWRERKEIKCAVLVKRSITTRMMVQSWSEVGLQWSPMRPHIRVEMRWAEAGADQAV